jgi:hypothetical protein
MNDEIEIDKDRRSLSRRSMRILAQTRSPTRLRQPKWFLIRWMV